MCSIAPAVGLPIQWSIPSECQQELFDDQTTVLCGRDWLNARREPCRTADVAGTDQRQSLRTRTYDDRNDQPRLRGRVRESKATYAFVWGGKTFRIAGQTDRALATHAGQTVVLTGTLNGDTVTVSHIAKANKK